MIGYISFNSDKKTITFRTENYEIYFSFSAFKEISGIIKINDYSDGIIKMSVFVDFPDKEYVEDHDMYVNLFEKAELLNIPNKELLNSVTSINVEPYTKEVDGIFFTGYYVNNRKFLKAFNIEKPNRITIFDGNIHNIEASTMSESMVEYCQECISIHNIFGFNPSDKTASAQQLCNNENACEFEEDDVFDEDDFFMMTYLDSF